MKKITVLLLLFSVLFLNSVLNAQKASSAISKESTDSPAKIITLEPASGYIDDIYEIDTIELYTEENPTYVAFTFDDFQLWAKVKGSTGIELGEFYLPEGDVITLTGTGNFTLELYSKEGSGNWQCEAMNESDYDLLYNWDWDELADLLEEIIAEPMSGYLEDQYEIDRINVDTIVSPAHVVFNWDSSMTLFTKIYNEAEELLATYDLSEGNVVSLNETGVYTLHVFTDAGYGNWSIETFNDEDYNAKYNSSNDSYDNAENFVKSFLNDMISDSDENLMDYISPSYIDNNYLTIADYEVNKYYPVDYVVDSYNSDTGIVKTRIWGEDKGWIHRLDFKVVWENDRFYLYPSSHSEDYIDPWYNADTYIK